MKTDKELAKKIRAEIFNKTVRELLIKEFLTKAAQIDDKG